MISTIRTENTVEVAIEHNAKLLGESVAESDSEAMAQFLIGLAEESERWNWALHCGDIACEMTVDESRQVARCLNKLVEAIQDRVTQ